MWKPTSDTKPGAVVVFPGRYDTQFKSVEVFTEGRRLAVAQFAGWANPESDKRLRQHWKFQKRAANWPFNIVVQATDPIGDLEAVTSVLCWRIENPRIRND